MAHFTYYADKYSACGKINNMHDWSIMYMPQSHKDAVNSKLEPISQSGALIVICKLCADWPHANFGLMTSSLKCIIIPSYSTTEKYFLSEWFWKQYLNNSSVSANVFH